VARWFSSGPNGAGKTTLLLMILGIRRLRSGSPFRGRNQLLDTALKWSFLSRASPGYDAAGLCAFPHLTVMRNVEFALACGNSVSNRKARRPRQKGLLADLAWHRLPRRRPRNLSG